MTIVVYLTASQAWFKTLVVIGDMWAVVDNAAEFGPCHMNKYYIHSCGNMNRVYLIVLSKQ